MPGPFAFSQHEVAKCQDAKNCTGAHNNIVDAIGTNTFMKVDNSRIIKDKEFCKRVPGRHLLLLYWLCQSLWLCGSQQTGKFWKRWEYQTTWPACWEICMQVRKQQLELDMEQQTGSKQEKEYVKAVYCHPDYLTYMQSTSWEMLVWMKHKLESRLVGDNVHCSTVYNSQDMAAT